MKHKNIKSVHGFLLISIFFLLSIIIIGWSSVSFDDSFKKISSVINTKSQIAAISGADSGLIGWWKFDEGSGTTASDSAGNNSGTLTNGPTWATGKVGGGALQFDGVDDYVNVDTISGLSQTYSLWVKTDIAPTSDVFMIGQTLSGSNRFGIGIDSGTGNYVMAHYNGSTYKILSGPSTLGSWTHLVATWDGVNQSSWIFYVNGVSKITSVSIGLSNLSGFRRIGTGEGSFFYQGSIDDIRIYNRALTTQDISDISNYVETEEPQVTGDTQSPTIPSNFTAATNSSSQISISWSASTDNVAVTGYRLYRNGNEIANTANTSYTDTGLSASTQYSYTVLAYDAANNQSNQSSTVSVTTQADNTNQSSSNNIYVSTSGSDSNPCTESQPCLTFTKAVSLLRSGGTLYIRGGIYDDKFNTTIPSGTSWSNSTTITAYPGEQVTIRPRTDNLISVARLTSGEYIIFDNIIFDAVNFTNATPVIKVTGTAKYIKFSNCEVKNTKRSHGFLVTSSSGSDSINSYVWITHCDIHDNGFGQIAGDGDTHGLYLSSGGNIVEYSKIHDNKVWGIQIFAGINSDNIIRYNEFYGTSNNISSGLTVAGSTGNNNLIYNNLFYNLQGVVINLLRPNATKIFNNTFYHNGQALIIGYAGSVTSNTEIYNNLIIDSSLASRAAVNITSGSQGTIFKNNVVFNSKFGNSSNHAVDVLDSGVNTTIINNIIGVGYDYANPQIPAVSGANNTVGGSFDPKFTNTSQNNFNLQSSSPAIDIGLSLPDVDDDYNGVSRPQGSAYDVGAYEYVSDINNSLPSPISGSCSITINQCTAGTFSNTTDTSTHYLWSCTGSNGGSSASCSLPISTNNSNTQTENSNITVTQNASTTKTVVNFTPTTFTLTLTQSSPTIRLLQQTLNNKGYLVSTTGSGSKGNETTYFGQATLTALKKYQCTILKRCSGNLHGVLDQETATSLGITLTTTPVTTTTNKFTRSLTIGSTGQDVKNLQIFLNSKGYTVSTTGAGSKGQETTYFGPATQRALIKFQEAYRSEILTPNGLTRGTGYFGPSTMRKVNGGL